MGTTTVSEQEVSKLLQALEPQYRAIAYDTVRHNCGHFCNECCLRLGVGRIPDWVNQLAVAGASAQTKVWEATDPKCCEAMAGEARRTLCHVERDEAVVGEKVPDNEVSEV